MSMLNLTTTITKANSTPRSKCKSIPTATFRVDACAVARRAYLRRAHWRANSEIVPLELKTGRAGGARVTHRAQAMLYAAMLVERRCAERPTTDDVRSSTANRSAAAERATALALRATPGDANRSAWLSAETLPRGGAAMLHYLADVAVPSEGVRVDWSALAALLQRRNEIVASLAGSDPLVRRHRALISMRLIGAAPPEARRLPPMKRDAHTCRHCMQLLACCTHHWVVERGSPLSAGCPLFDARSFSFVALRLLLKQASAKASLKALSARSRRVTLVGVLSLSLDKFSFPCSTKSFIRVGIAPWRSKRV